jgi:hypothetical protein
MGKGYQILLHRGIQQEPLTKLETAFVEQLTPIAVGLKQANALNYLIAAMLYYVPGKMLVRDAKNRLPQWLFADYQRVFESPEVLEKIQQSLKLRQAQANLVNINNLQFINRLMGCANLYEIDPTHQSVVEELYQLRQQIAQLLAQLSEAEFASITSTSVTQAYQILLNSGFWQQPLRVRDQEFLQTLGIDSIQSLNEPTSIPQQLIALLYYNPTHLPSLNLMSFPMPWQDIILLFLESNQSSNSLK